MCVEIRTGVIVEQCFLSERCDCSAFPHSRDWTSAAYAGFAAVLSRSDFPCLFGRKAFWRESLKFLFVRGAADLVAGVLAYTTFVKTTSLDTRLYSPLVIVFKHDGFANLADEHTFCWEQLRILHENDPREWPGSVPTDPADSRWTFCFDGVQLFVNMSCPGHRHLKSRNLGQSVIFIVNPRQNFDAGASLNSRKGVTVRQTIRERVRRYNDGVVPDGLGFFGDDINLEWKQYQLNEPGSQAVRKCPFVPSKRMEGDGF